MDRSVVVEKLESLRRCMIRIETRRAATLDALLTDLDLQDILSFNLTRAVQISVDLAAHLVADLDIAPPSTMAESFRVLGTEGILEEDLADRLAGAVGFRNVAVHAYQSIDWAIVHAISHRHVEDLRSFAAAVTRHADLDA